MLTHREFLELDEWRRIAQRLGELFQMNTERAVCEDKDIGNVRYCKGWIDAINEMLDLPRQLLPHPLDDEEKDTYLEPLGSQPESDSYISVKKDGSVY